MRRPALALLAAVLLTACFGGPPPGPAWRIRAAEASQRYYTAMLTGDLQRARSSLRRALEAASRSDDLRSLARVHLGRAAMELALLRKPGWERVDEIVALSGDPGLAAYRRFLTGRPEAGDGKLLPEPLAAPARYLREGQPGALDRSIAAIGQARRRVVAAAVAHRRFPDRRAFVDHAVAAASGEGWRGVLLTWLPLQAEAAEAAGADAEAAAIRNRLRWLRDPLEGRSGDGG